MAITINGSGTIAGLTPGGLPDGSVTPADTQVGALPSMVRLQAASGYGSASTCIRRFSNVVTNQGSDITYTDSATLGASFTINASGVYAISFTDQFNSSQWLGISLNTASPSTAFTSILASEMLNGAITVLASNSSSVSSTVYLAAGSIVRPHTQGTPSGTVTQVSYFVITRVA